MYDVSSFVESIGSDNDFFITTCKTIKIEKKNIKHVFKKLTFSYDSL